ncbi:MAG: nucleotidyltransferase domain-containing protein [Ktedonobacterales bacterium]
MDTTDTTDDASANYATPLADAEWAALISLFDGEGITAMALFGSYARGEATHYSDVDIVRFASELPAEERDRYTLRLVGGRLVSVTTTTIATKREELKHPEGAIWVVPALHQARILLDRDGAFTALQTEAEAFRWELLQPAADAYASTMLMGLTEEVSKVVGALARGDESAMLYGALGLQQELTRTVLVQRGVLLRSENDFFAQAQAAVGPTSEWTRLHRFIVGFDPLPAGETPARARGLAALALYRESVALLQPIIRPDDQAVIDHALATLDPWLMSDRD